MNKLKRTMAAWKPYVFALTTLGTMLFAVGAHWKPH
jgi:hypothetical protein